MTNSIYESFCILNLILMNGATLRVPRGVGEDEPLMDASRGASRFKRNTATITASEAALATDAHNSLRRQEVADVTEGVSNMAFMSHNQELADLAQKVVDTCVFKHNFTSLNSNNLPYSEVGQNLYLSSTLDITYAVTQWVEKEKAHYTFANMACSKVCGHYTQVVWAESNLVGCAYHFCTRATDDGITYNNVWIFACNYGPPGNLAGTQPYLKGTNCAMCATGQYTCDRGLCRDKCKCQEAGLTCDCMANCQNGGTQLSDCTCACPTGWIENDCSAPCGDTHAHCNNGWFTAQCTDPTHGASISNYCRTMCGKCGAVVKNATTCPTLGPTIAPGPSSTFATSTSVDPCSQMTCQNGGTKPKDTACSGYLIAICLSLVATMVRL